MNDALKDAHGALYREACALLRELEAVKTGTVLDHAARYIGIMREHVAPLRTAIDDIEFAERAAALIGGTF